jgi:hypothetical protein
VVYAGGYLVGSLLVARTEELSFAIIRTVAELNADRHRVSASLVFSFPWFVLPCVLLINTLPVRARTALAWTSVSRPWSMNKSVTARKKRPSVSTPAMTDGIQGTARLICSHMLVHVSESSVS